MSARERCNHCAKGLIPGKEVWLEHNAWRRTWHAENTQPAEESQGHFAFGAACARKVLGGCDPQKWGEA